MTPTSTLASSLHWVASLAHRPAWPWPPCCAPPGHVLSGVSLALLRLLQQNARDGRFHGAPTYSGAGVCRARSWVWPSACSLRPVLMLGGGVGGDINGGLKVSGILSYKSTNLTLISPKQSPNTTTLGIGASVCEFRVILRHLQQRCASSSCCLVAVQISLYEGSSPASLQADSSQDPSPLGVSSSLNGLSCLIFVLSPHAPDRRKEHRKTESHPICWINNRVMAFGFHCGICGSQNRVCQSKP